MHDALVSIERSNTSSVEISYALCGEIEIKLLNSIFACKLTL